MPISPYYEIYSCQRRKDIYRSPLKVQSSNTGACRSLTIMNLADSSLWATGLIESEGPRPRCVIHHAILQSQYALFIKAGARMRETGCKRWCPPPPLFVLLAPPSLSFITSDEPAVSWLINKRRLELEHLLKFSRVLFFLSFTLTHFQPQLWEEWGILKHQRRGEWGRQRENNFNVCAFKHSEVWPFAN